MFLCQTLSNLNDGDGAGWIGFQGIVGRGDLFLQPEFDSLVASDERAEAISDYFALAGILTCSNFFTDKLGHLVWKGDAELLG